MSFGADATVDYRKAPAEQIAEIKSRTSGKFGVVFDSVAKQPDFAFDILQLSTAAKKHFLTTDDWCVDLPSTFPLLSIHNASILLPTHRSPIVSNNYISKQVSDYVS